MNRMRSTAFMVVLGVLMVLVATRWTLAADELRIGLPDYPRRINRSLPKPIQGEEMRLGILKLHPSFSSTVEVDDNIRLSDTDAITDVVFTQVPALGVEMDLGDHRLEGGYGMEFVTFAKEEEENAVNLLANALLELNFDNLQITAEDTFERTTSRLFSETSVRDRAAINVVDILARYDRPMWVGELGWTHNTIDHRTDALDTRDLGEDVIQILGGYKILPKTLAFLETDFGLVRYDTNTTNPDHTYWEIFGGFRGDPTEDFNWTAKLGYQGRWLDDTHTGTNFQDFHGLVTDADAEYHPSVDDVVRLRYQRTVRPSTFGGNNFYRQDQVTASYSRKFLEKWLFSPKVSWQLNDYPVDGTAAGVTKNRADHIFQAACEFRYEIQKWLSVGLAYKFRGRNSNLSPFDFSNNRYSFDVSLAF